MVAEFSTLLDSLGTPARILVVILVALLAHLAVLVLRSVGRLIARLRGALTPKVSSLIGLTISTTVFAIYFAAVGFVLQELGVPLAAYFASASVIGLAVAFGSQSVVQDVVTGLTLIFADLIAVGDMVTLGGLSGRVEHVGMRFVTLRNPQGALVHVPNRSITNVLSFPSGYLRCLVDVQLRGDAAQREAVVALVDATAASVREQFTGIFVHPHDAEGRFGDAQGREYYRLKFRLWPDRGDVMEKLVRPELVARLKELDPAYAEWMVAVAFEIEARDRPVRLARG